MPNITSAADAPKTSADIIPFPVSVTTERAHDVDTRPTTAIAETPAELLRRALQMLDAAQAEQRVAIAQWRAALKNLSTSVDGLGRSLHRYEGGLQSIAAHLPPPG